MSRMSVPMRIKQTVNRDEQEGREQEDREQKGREKEDREQGDREQEGREHGQHNQAH